LKAEDKGVVLGVQIALAGQKVKAKEPIVAPAFADFEVGRELADNVLAGILAQLVNHLNAVFVPKRTAIILKLTAPLAYNTASQLVAHGSNLARKGLTPVPQSRRKMSKTFTIIFFKSSALRT